MKLKVNIIERDAFEEDLKVDFDVILFSLMVSIEGNIVFCKTKEKL